MIEIKIHTTDFKVVIKKGLNKKGKIKFLEKLTTDEDVVIEKGLNKKQN